MRGGRRKGAGRKAGQRKEVYQRWRFEAGQRCEVLWREAYPTPPGMKPSPIDYAWAGAIRPRARKRIIAQVAKEKWLSWKVVESCWRQYERFEARLEQDV